VAALQPVTPPSHEPVEVVEMKEYLRVTSPAEDRLISTLIREARQQFDGRDAWFHRALITQQWQLNVDTFPTPYTWASWGSPWPPPAYVWPEVMVWWPRQYAIILPLPPLQSVQSVTYIDETGATQTLDPSAYVVDTQSEPGAIMPSYGTVWPTTRWVPNAVTVKFTAGYGAAPAVPEPIKVWIKQAVAYRYDNRSLLTTLPTSFYWALANYKVVWSA